MSTPSLVPREDGARKLVGLFGTEASPDGDTTADKIFRFIPGTVSSWPVSPGSRERGSGGLRVTARVCPACAGPGVFPVGPGESSPRHREEVGAALPWEAHRPKV